MPAAGGQRIDKWLFFARVVKSRSIAQKLATSGRVRINGEKCEQASENVKVGDVLTITLERRILVYRLLSLGFRRGPADEARTLYEDMSQPTEHDAGLPDALPPFRGAKR